MSGAMKKAMAVDSMHCMSMYVCILPLQTSQYHMQSLLSLLFSAVPHLSLSSPHFRSVLAGARSILQGVA